MAMGECGPLSQCARSGHVDALDHGPAGDERAILSAAEQSMRIAAHGKGLDYEQEAIDSIRRSWDHADKTCMALALADAQVWATLHLARTTAKKSRRRREDHT